MVKIQIVGGSSAKCDQFARNAEEAAEELQIDYAVQKVTSYHKMSQMGILLTPALVIDGVIKSSGKVLEKEEIKELLSA